MILAAVIIILVIISLGMSYVSLKSDMKKQKHVEDVKQRLAKGKVIFYAPSSDSSSK